MQNSSHKKRISIIGLGYVGAVSSSCLASMGHEVIGVDVEQEKVDVINRGIAPIHEPDLQTLISEQIQSGRLSATTDLHQALKETDISFICVGTPTNQYGEIQLAYVKKVVAAIAEEIKTSGKSHITVMRSTVPPGTGSRVVIPIVNDILDFESQSKFNYVSNPEFLREGSAIFDFMNPPKTVIGGENNEAVQEVSEIYHAIDAPMLKTRLAVAEMVKYVNNTWHALKVAFANEVGSLSRELNVDGQAVMDIFCQDTKLNLSSYYLNPGFAFGGSCLPKDVRGLTGIARQYGLELPLMNSIIPSNDEHIARAYHLIAGPGVKTIGILGISFKADTDDIRESPVVTLAKSLYKRGFKVLIYDHNVHDSIVGRPSSQNIIQQLDAITECMCTDLQHVIDESDTVVIGNNHHDFDQLLNKISNEKHVVDLVRITNEMSHDNYDGIAW